MLTFYTPVLTVFQIQQNSEGTHGLAHLTSATKKKEKKKNNNNNNK